MMATTFFGGRGPVVEYARKIKEKSFDDAGSKLGIIVVRLIWGFPLSL